MGRLDASGTTRLVLADDSRVVLAAIADLLASDPRCEVVGTAPDGEATLRVVDEVRPDVVVIDLHMPHGGPELVRALRSRTPAPAVVCYSADPRGEDVMRAAGAVGYAIKGDPEVDLIEFVLGAHEVAMPPRILA